MTHSASPIGTEKKSFAGRYQLKRMPLDVFLGKPVLKDWKNDIAVSKRLSNLLGEQTPPIEPPPPPKVFTVPKALKHKFLRRKSSGSPVPRFEPHKPKKPRPID